MAVDVPAWTVLVPVSRLVPVLSVSCLKAVSSSICFLSFSVFAILSLSATIRIDRTCLREAPLQILQFFIQRIRVCRRRFLTIQIS